MVCHLLPFAKVFLQLLPENQVVLPEFYLLFARNGHFEEEKKNLKWVQPPAPPPTSYAYKFNLSSRTTPHRGQFPTGWK